MSSETEADYLVDRRRLRGRLSFWRALAFVAAIAAIVAIGLKLTGGPANLALHGQHIALDLRFARAAIQLVVVLDVVLIGFHGVYCRDVRGWITYAE